MTAALPNVAKPDTKTSDVKSSLPDDSTQWTDEQFAWFVESLKLTDDERTTLKQWTGGTLTRLPPELVNTLRTQGMASLQHYVGKIAYNNDLAYPAARWYTRPQTAVVQSAPPNASVSISPDVSSTSWNELTARVTAAVLDTGAKRLPDGTILVPFNPEDKDDDDDIYG